MGDEPGSEQLFEATSALGQNWNVLGSMRLQGESGSWRVPATPGNMFFRARRIFDEDAQFAENFRLIDHEGKSRELYYYVSLGTLKAIVITFAQGNYAEFAPKIANIKNRAIFQNNVMFWTIETGAAMDRASIKSAVAAAGITWPVFHDPLHLTTRDYNANFSGETFVIQRADMRIVYRGIIEDGANQFVASALSNVVNLQAVATTRVEPRVSPLAKASRPVADYATVIAPLLQSKCVTCHSPDNIAPFALTSHSSVTAFASVMKEEIMEGNMPPWHADPLYGNFKNDISLTPEQKATLVDWLAAGAPRGNGPDPLETVPPAPPKWPAELGEPDQIVTIPTQDIPASGTVAYRYILANSTNTEDRWLRAAVVRPSNRRVVHHYIVWEGHSNFAQLSGLATYVPGETDTAFPEGTGILLKANMPMTFNLHYTATGQAETDKPELGLWYADAPPAAELKAAAPLNLVFTFGGTTIPANNPEFQMVATHTFSNPARLYSFSPHMHVRGLRMRFELVLPGSSTRQVLCSVPNYDFHWQSTYYLRQPLDLPAQSRIEITGAFDNSAQNHHNPNPNVGVKWGEQSWEEMFIGYMEYSDR